MTNDASEPVAFHNLMAIAADHTAAAWEAFRPGIQRLPLYQVGPDGQSAALLKYDPGAEVPRHHHPGFEHIWVLEGSQTDDNGHYPKGSLVVNPPGSAHSVYSEEGCVVLAIWEAPVVFEQ